MGVGAAVHSAPTSLQPLAGDQALASEPGAHVWLSASAGTGKTHVLTARVYRLLLGGVRPENILCLTFTKAGAAEMAERIHNRLAQWVQMDDPALFKDLEALGEEAGPEARARARRLFAEVLEATGGGLRIQTIHSFCQQLLTAFPVEAGLAPGFRPLDDRARRDLARQTLAELVTQAEAHGNDALIDAMRALSLRAGEAGAEAFLMRCAAAQASLAALPDQIEAWLRAELGLPEGDIDAAIADECSDERFDISTLKWVAAQNALWATPRGLARCEVISQWLDSDPRDRAISLAKLHGCWAKVDEIGRAHV
jgi:ATP-dependent helicase/nuclease subunit A